MQSIRDRQTRRGFLKMSAAGAAGLLITGLGLHTAEADQAKPAGKIPVGLQLYSVRGECGKDGGKNLPKVIEAVAKMGYQGVEFAGYYGWDAKGIRKMLDDNGVQCCGTHIGIETMLGDNLAKTIEFNKTVGNRFLIAPILRGQYTKDAEAWKKTAGVFNEIAEKLKPHEMYCGYHSHGPDFKAMDGSTPWEIFFRNADKRVVMQLDTGNCMAGKGDPVAILKEFPGRALTVHCKEYGGAGQGLIGEGKVDWKQVIDLCTAGGTQWFIIEHERRGADALDSVAKCIVNFMKLVKKEQ